MASGIRAFGRVVIRRELNRADYAFLAVRIFLIIGAAVWVLYGPATVSYIPLSRVAAAFAVYSLIYYFFLLSTTYDVARLYLYAMCFDVFFVGLAVYVSGGFYSILYLGLYLIVTVYAIYFGLVVGWLVSVYSSIVYLGMIYKPSLIEHWLDIATRISFLWFVGMMAGLLADKARRDKMYVENLNRNLQQANEQLQGRLRELAALHAASRAVSSGLDTDGLLRRVASVLCQTLNLRLASIWLKHPEGQFARRALCTCDGEPEDEDAAAVAEYQRALTRVNPVFLGPNGTESAKTEQRANTICVPFSTHEGITGVLVARKGPGETFTSSEVELLTAIANQITIGIENRQRYAEIARRAITDELTQVFNRRYFQQRLWEEHQRAERYHRSLGLALLDLDDFKEINDTWGHPMGDKVLRAAAAALRSTARGSDVVARYGGEEFVVLLPEADPMSAELAAERFRIEVSRAISGWEELGGRTITASCGCAVYPHDARSPEELLSCADEALYIAKRSGKNRTVSFSATRVAREKAE